MRTWAMVLGIAAMLLCLGQPVQAGSAMAERTAHVVQTGLASAHMKCCPESSANSRTCASCPVIPVSISELRPPLRSEGARFDHHMPMLEGVSLYPDVPPPR